MAENRELSSPLSWPQKRASSNVKQAYFDRMTISEAVECVGKMISGYSNGKAEKAYIGTMAALFCQYPRQVSTQCADPIKGVARECKFIPTVADVVAWCEPRMTTMRTVVDYDARSEAQMREREKIAHGGVEDKAAVLARIRRDIAAAGMPMFDDKRRHHGETPETVKAKFGISDAEWVAIKDAPIVDQWVLER